jgi:Protein of unknown function (DUF3396)
MLDAETLYNQNATRFSLRFFVRGKTEVEGRFMLELANTFLSDLLFPGCRPVSLDTKLPGMGRKLNMGEFSERRWNASVKKILAGQYAVVGITAQTRDFPNQTITLTVHVNPPGGTEFMTAGDIEIHCSIAYLRHLAASPQKVEALLRFGKTAWNGIDGGPAYGYGSLAINSPRVDVMEWMKAPLGTPVPINAPSERVHAIPVACVGDVENNLEQLYCQDCGIKGAFWANYLNAVHVRMAGGEQELRAKLPGMRIESLDHGGLLVVATLSPLPDDNEENRRRFLQLHAALQPAFLSREETSEGKRQMLGYFYRERSSVVP